MPTRATGRRLFDHLFASTCRVEQAGKRERVKSLVALSPFLLYLPEIHVNIKNYFFIRTMSKINIDPRQLLEFSNATSTRRFQKLQKLRDFHVAYHNKMSFVILEAKRSI